MGFKMGFYHAIGSPHDGGLRQPCALAVNLDRGLFRRPVAASIMAAAVKHDFTFAARTLARHGRNPSFAAWLLALRSPAMQIDLQINPDVLDLVKLHLRFGAPVALVTGMRREIALGVRQLLDLPESVSCLGAEGAGRLSHIREARLLAAYFGAHNFDYVGRARPDGAAQMARRCYLVGATRASKRAGATFGAPIVALSGAVQWQSRVVPVARLVGMLDPTREMSLGAAASYAIWERESPALPVVAAEPKPEFKVARSRRPGRRQT